MSIVRITVIALLIAVSDGLFQSYANDDLSPRIPHSSHRRTPVVEAVSKALPSVVNISTERIVTQRLYRRGYADPFTDLFNRFFGLQQKHYKTSSLGSGVIVDKDGLILTNNHVIQRASKIIVNLEDGTNLEAKPIATDEKNDLALLKVDAAGIHLQAVEFAVPDDLYLGETAISIGNPFGLGHSVVVGVISAVGRKFIYDDRVLFDDILQTDAAINPGNSGGPIVNADGQLIGINLAIHGDAEGIGFAIPLKRIEDVLVRWLMPSRIGSNIVGIIPKSRPTSAVERYVVIDSILPDSPAAKTGLNKGDTIIGINGVKVEQAIDVCRILWKLKEGDEIVIDVDEGRSVKLTVEAIPELSGEELARKKLGIELQELTARLAEALSLPYSRGLVISDVKANSILARHGVRRGDVIIQIGEMPIANFTDLFRALSRFRTGDLLELTVDRVEIARGHVFIHRYVLDVPV